MKRNKSLKNTNSQKKKNRKEQQIQPNRDTFKQLTYKESSSTS